jgi:hypothetical protein
MRDYGKVFSSFWTSQDIRDLTEDGRSLALYLMTCPHGNMLGCFRLPNAYASDDLQWPFERVSKGFQELYRNGFATRCERSFWVVIHKHLKWNRLDNENVGKAAAKLFDSLTPPDDVKALLAKALQEFGKNLPAFKLAEIERVLEGYRNGIETVSKPVTVAVAVTVPIAVTGTETGIANPGGLVVPSVAGDLSGDAAKPEKKTKSECPHQDIITLYHEILPMCPMVKDWTPSRATQLRTRWNEDPVRQHLDYWRNLFNYVAKCDFLVGKANGKNPFLADLEWITKSGNFTKIREGKYENRQAA